MILTVLLLLNINLVEKSAQMLYNFCLFIGVNSNTYRFVDSLLNEELHSPI
jgi:hypothetical protein